MALGLPHQGRAADWLMLQGVEPSDTAHKFFGAAQLTYTYNDCQAFSGLAAPDGTPTGNPNAGPGLNNGLYVNNCRVGPKLGNTSGLMLDNLYLGARGNLVPGRINYFLAGNAGENAANYLPFKTSRERLVSLTDASLSLNYIPGLRVRAGLFKKPGPEELLQSIETANYISQTDFIARIQIERFVYGNSRSGAPIAGQGYAGNISSYGYDSDTGRDWGVQLFDAFKHETWTHSYAVMIGNGNGIHQWDNNSNKDVNLYWSSEYDLSGSTTADDPPAAKKGPFKHGVKLYGWYQQGVRNFETDASGTPSRDFDRIRYGVGVHALGRLFGASRGKHRLGVELMWADGMVHYFPTGNAANGLYGGNTMQFAAEKGNKARGVTADYGYYLGQHWQFDIRYSRDNALYQTAGVWLASDQRIYTDWILGLNYHFSPKTRFTFNYTVRDVNAPNAVVPVAATTTAINNAAVQTNNYSIVTGSVGNRLDIRLTHSF